MCSAQLCLRSLIQTTVRYMLLLGFNNRPGGNAIGDPGSAISNYQEDAIRSAGFYGTVAWTLLSIGVLLCCMGEGWKWYIERGGAVPKVEAFLNTPLGALRRVRQGNRSHAILFFCAINA